MELGSINVVKLVSNFKVDSPNCCLAKKIMRDDRRHLTPVANLNEADKYLLPSALSARARISSYMERKEEMSQGMHSEDSSRALRFHLRTLTGRSSFDCHDSSPRTSLVL